MQPVLFSSAGGRATPGDGEGICIRLRRSAPPKMSCLGFRIQRLAVPLHEKAPVAQRGGCDQRHAWPGVPKRCQEILRTPASYQMAQSNVPKGKRHRKRLSHTFFVVMGLQRPRCRYALASAEKGVLSNCMHHSARALLFSPTGPLNSFAALGVHRALYNRRTEIAV